MKMIVDLKKARPLLDEDGALTKHGMVIAHAYAKQWLKGDRDLQLERAHPELEDLFYDVRCDSELARRHAS